MKEVASRKSHDSVRALIKRINSDPAERRNFLLKPSEALSKVGVTLNTKASKELQVVVREFLRKYPEVGLLPTGVAGARRVSKRKPKGVAGGVFDGSVDEGAARSGDGGDMVVV